MGEFTPHTLARNSPSWMCRSVPQTPHALTLSCSSASASSSTIFAGFTYQDVIFTQLWKRNFDDAELLGLGVFWNPDQSDFLFWQRPPRKEFKWGYVRSAFILVGRFGAMMTVVYVRDCVRRKNSVKQVCAIGGKVQ